MKRKSLARSCAAAVAAFGLVTGSVASAATTALPAMNPTTIYSPTMNPLVALSALGSVQSRTAICAAGAAAAAGAAGAAATTAQVTGAQPGCVLPVVDAPPPAVVSEVPPPPVMLPPAAAPAAGLGFLPILLGLGAIVAAVLLLRGDDGDDEINIDLPTSP